ncbi:hypothetical protein P4O66_022929 [Electrophorus voltai]|uniref:GRAM domain-containing protein n=1 Tax=Electrophorus voltai TaxID=2609070 RepID=A0AAD8ZL99_9TELE|nr:hypothetical protein P4O66_022929 [Electrophorus voltai]
MENPLTCDDSVLKNCYNSDRPTCSVSPSQQTVLEPPCHEAENGGEERSRKTTQSDAPLAMDTESDILGRRRKPTLIRSRTFDPSILSQLQSDTESKIERKKLRSCQSVLLNGKDQISYSYIIFQFLRTNNQYHKVFKDINENEQLKQSYTCALQKDILYQGRLFVSDNWICFHSKVFGKDTKIVIPVTSVKVIQKTKTAILVPNALVITTAQEKDKCLGNSSIPASAHRNYRVIPSALPLDFTADLSNLDGPVSHRRQVIGDSSSSDSPDLPEYEKLSEYPKHSQVFKNVVKQDSVSVTYPQQAKHEQCAYDVKAMRQYSFNGLLMVYLILVFILVLSSCYMALKIISLEQRLTSLRSMTELSLSGDDHHSLHPEDNAEIYSVLSMNLVKLEKVPT